MPEFPENYVSVSHWGMFSLGEQRNYVPIQNRRIPKSFIPAASWMPRRELPAKSPFYKV